MRTTSLSTANWSSSVSLEADAMMSSPRAVAALRTHIATNVLDAPAPHTTRTFIAAPFYSFIPCWVSSSVRASTLSSSHAETCLERSLPAARDG
jgi:hypothetical protein